MPLVLVHGVPETPELWGPLRSHLRRDDVVALQLPGFGCPLPEGFEPTKEGYAAWVAGELEPLAGDGPLDLLGHDWGAGFVVRTVTTRPELVRRWVVDATGTSDVQQKWHALAKVWQTPGAGEEFFEVRLAMPPEQNAEVMASFGVPHEHALTMSGWTDATMAQCILTLYRSAVEVGKEWGADFHDVEAPGLVLVPSEDPFQSAARSRAVAARVGARAVDLEGLGHWWMLQAPDRVAPVVEEFFAE